MTQKSSASLLATPPSHLFDVSFRDQNLPQEWKIAVVCTHSPTTSHENYRPISINSTCFRSIEKTINEFLKQYLLHQDILENAFCIYIRAVLEYSSSVWNPRRKVLTDSIEKLQKRFTEAIPSSLSAKA